MKHVDLFAEFLRLERLSKMGDPLERVSVTLDWEMFRPILNKVFHKEERGTGGRPPWDYILMFKILLLQSWYNIADDKTEYMINDRLSFQRFLGLSLTDKVPDAKTIWLFREKLSESGSYAELFQLFSSQMERQGIIARRGSIVDASFVDVPRQRNSRAENRKIKEGAVPEEWEKPENVNKLRQKDTEARWTKKNNETHYGYKDHVKVDADSKMIITSEVTDASVHDSQTVVDLIDKQDRDIYGDNAYTGKKLHGKLYEKNPELKLSINEKGYRNRPLTDEQKTSNRKKSRIRARVEHIFGHITNSMGGMTIRCIGLRRARCAIMLKNLAYNLTRFAYLFTSNRLPLAI